MNLRDWAAPHGRIAALAREVGLSYSFAYQIVTGRRGVPAKYCSAIKAATGGLVTFQELRPCDWQEIWPELAAKKPKRTRKAKPSSGGKP